MKTSKKILIISIVVAFIFLVAAVFGWVGTAFGLPFWPITVGICVLQIVGKILFDRYYEYNLLKTSLEEYTSKPYKEYLVPLICQVCGKTDNVSMDLTKTEYRCTNCERMNAIYVTFATAAMQNETTNATH
jgi:hypothetical protein